MTTPIWHGEAQIAAWGESNSSGTWVRLRLHPDDAGPSNPFKGYEGQPVRVVVAPLEDEPEVAPQTVEKPRRRWDELPLSQQAALRCNDERFRAWLGADTTHEAATEVRSMCGVSSRADFDVDALAAERWLTLDAEYARWAGLLTEERG